MKKFVVKTLVALLPLLACISAQADDVLMWMVKDPVITDNGMVKKSIPDYYPDQISHAKVRVVQTAHKDEYIAGDYDYDEVYLNLANWDGQKWTEGQASVVSIGNSEGSWGTGGSTAYAYLGNIGSGYSFAIELGHWQQSGDNWDWVVAATSEVWDYQNLYDNGHIGDQLSMQEKGAWATPAYAAPEPSSTMLLLIGGSLLLLRRRREKEKTVDFGSEVA